jgi:hypothetical protein
MTTFYKFLVWSALVMSLTTTLTLSWEVKSMETRFEVLKWYIFEYHGKGHVQL